MNFGELKHAVARMAGQDATTLEADVNSSLGLALNNALVALTKEKLAWYRAEFTAAVAVDQEYVSLPPDLYAFMTDVRDADGDKIYLQDPIHSIDFSVQLSNISKRTASIQGGSPIDYYTTGTITMAQGSTSITSSGATFTAAMVNRVVIAEDDKEWYLITAVDTGTNTLTAHTARVGSSLSTSDYIIDPANTRRLKFQPAVAEAEDYTYHYFRTPRKMVADTDVPELPEEHQDFLLWRAREFWTHADEERQVVVKYAAGKAAMCLSEIRRSMVFLHGPIMINPMGTLPV